MARLFPTPCINQRGPVPFHQFLLVGREAFTGLQTRKRVSGLKLLGILQDVIPAYARRHWHRQLRGFCFDRRLFRKLAFGKHAARH